jgi:hypothetical protein
VDREEFVKALDDYFDNRARIDSETHQAHHEWIAKQVERNSERILLFREARRTLVQWSVMGMLTTLGTMVALGASGAWQIVERVFHK